MHSGKIAASNRSSLIEDAASGATQPTRPAATSRDMGPDPTYGLEGNVDAAKAPRREGVHRLPEQALAAPDLEREQSRVRLRHQGRQKAVMVALLAPPHAVILVPALLGIPMRRAQARPHPGSAAANAGAAARGPVQLCKRVGRPSRLPGPAAPFALSRRLLRPALRSAVPGRAGPPAPLCWHARIRLRGAAQCHECRLPCCRRVRRQVDHAVTERRAEGRHTAAGRDRGFA